MRIDGGAEQVLFFNDTEHQHSVKARFGNGGDLQIYHDGTDNRIHNDTGHLKIEIDANDKDLQIFADDGSGGTSRVL